MLPIGTKIFHPGHGHGEVVAHNGKEVNKYLKENLEEACEIASATGLLSALSRSFYTGDRYPNVIKFLSGYKDVYADIEIQVIN